MKKIERILIIIGIIIIAYLLLIRRQAYSTDYVDVLDQAMDKPVSAISVMISESNTLQEFEFDLLDTDSSFVDGTLNEWDDKDSLSWYVTKLFGEISNMDTVKEEGEYKSEDLYRINLNIDFKEGTHYDEPHKFIVYVDNKLDILFIPETFDNENRMDTSLLNYSCFHLDEKAKAYVNELKKEVIVE